MKAKTKKCRVIVRGNDVNEVQVDRITCCGIYEVHNLQSNPWSVIYKLAIELNRDYNMIIFSDAVQIKHGARLASLIKRYKLGSLTVSKVVHNPNTNNNIKMWIFYPNWSVLRQIVDSTESIDNDDWSATDYWLTL